MDAAETARRFTALYHRAFVRFHRRGRPDVPELTREALAVLLHLSDTGPLTIAEACRHFSRSQAAMSDLVTRLERRGLLARMQDERDRRRTLVWMTEDGRRRLELETTVLDPEPLAAALGVLGVEQREELLRSFAALLGERTNESDPRVQEEAP